MRLSRFPLTFAFLAAVALWLAASPLSATPDIHVERAWDSLEVPNGNSFAFPNIATGVATSRLFRIENHGTSTLTLSNYTSLVSGAGFFQIENPSLDVAAGGSTTFRVRFQRGTAGMYFGHITINNNSSQTPYVIHLVASAGTFPPPAQSMFVLSSAERTVWNPDWKGLQSQPQCKWIDDPLDQNDKTPWTGTEAGALRYFWESFCFGQPQGPIDPATAELKWFDPNGSGSQNHGPLALGAAALGQALGGTWQKYDEAADKALQILALDLQPTGQGHMRHESVGKYSGYWEGGIAAMALAGRYQPQGATRGAELLAAARNWWRDHVAILRKLRYTDGQVALIGARLGGESGYIDSRAALSAAVNLQLVDSQSYSYTQLHPWIQGLLTSGNQPKEGTLGPDELDWRDPREVPQRWIVLRAKQLGALEPVPANHPVRCLAHRSSSQPAHVWRWQAGGRTYTGLDWVYGLAENNGGVRWQVSWGPVSPHPGNVVEVEAGSNGAGYPGKGPHKSPLSVQKVELLIPGCPYP